MKRISNNMIIAYILLIPLLVLFPYIQGKPNETMLDTDLSAGPCDTTSRTMIYTWAWKEKPVRFDLLGREDIYFPFQGITPNNTTCYLELDEENSSCAVEYYDHHGRYVTTITYPLSDSPITIHSHKWIGGQRCRALKGTLTVTVREVVNANNLHIALMGAHHSYRNLFYPSGRATPVSNNWRKLYGDGRIEYSY